MSVPVPDRLVRPHPLVVELRDVSTPKRAREPWPRIERGRLRPLAVSRAYLSRALRIVQALITKGERRGYGAVASAPSPSGMRELCLVIDGNEFALTIAEKDGRLRLWLPREYSGRRQWNEGPRGSLESKLGDVLTELERRAEEIAERRRAQEEERRRREEARERALLAARERYAEFYRADVLRREVGNWRLAGEIRVYCQALREHGTRSGSVIPWIGWAEAYADRIDPLLGEPGMPEVPEPTHEELRPFLRELGARDPMWG